MSVSVAPDEPVIVLELLPVEACLVATALLIMAKRLPDSPVPGPDFAKWAAGLGRQLLSEVEGAAR